MRNKLLVIGITSIVLAGCAGSLAERKIDAADVTTRWGEPVEPRFTSWDVTARDWNCKGCYK